MFNREENKLQSFFNTALCMSSVVVVVARVLARVRFIARSLLRTDESVPRRLIRLLFKAMFSLIGSTALHLCRFKR